MRRTFARSSADRRPRAASAEAERRSGPFGPWDAIVLDVDNGPDFLIHGDNRALYTGSGLQAAYGQLTSGGTLAIWCQGRWAPLLDELRRLAPTAREHLVRGDARRATIRVRDLHRDVGPDRLCAMTSEGDFRIEHDTMGEVRVPARALWKAQTQRAVENFPISGVPIDPALIAALGLIKGAAAQTNARLGVLSRGSRRRRSTRRPRPSPRMITTPSSRSTSSRPARAPRAT